MSLAEVGVGHSLSTLSLLSCGLMPLALTTKPLSSQNGKDLTQMKQMLLRSFGVNNQAIQVNGDKRTTAIKIMSIVLWNVAGALNRPKGITLN